MEGGDHAHALPVSSTHSVMRNVKRTKNEFTVQPGSGNVPMLVMGLGIYLYGLERRVIRAVSNMRQLKPLFILSKWDLGEVSDQLRQYGFTYRKAPFGYLGFARPYWTLINVWHMPSLFWKVHKAAKEHNARVLLFVSVLSFINALPVFVAMRLLSRRRFVFYLGDIGGGTAVQRLICRIADLFADVFIVNANAVKEGLRRNGIRRTAIHVVYNGVDLDRFAAATPVNWRVLFGWPDDAMVFGYVGQLNENKGVTDFLAAAKLTSERLAAARFVVLGDQPQGTNYAQQLKEDYSDLNGRLEFLGFMPNVEQYYRAMDVVVVPSRHNDPAPNVNIEAMASAVPVIATATGGSPELVEDGVTGFLVPPRNPVQIYQRMMELADDHSRAKKMGIAGLERCQRLFDAKRNAQMVERLILGDTTSPANRPEALST
jgi:glycosyltransferase involved in cell wall biosynthesis